jgi:hypothetical protein
LGDEWVSATELTARLGLEVRSFRNSTWGFRRRRIPNHGRGPQYEYHWPDARRIWLERHPTNPLYFYEPSNEALWAWRKIGLAALARHLNCNRATLSRHLRSRGWIWRRGVDAQMAEVAFAPCVLCGETTAVCELNLLRECKCCRVRMDGGQDG